MRAPGKTTAGRRRRGSGSGSRSAVPSCGRAREAEISKRQPVRPAMARSRRWSRAASRSFSPTTSTTRRRRRSCASCGARDRRGWRACGGRSRCAVCGWCGRSSRCRVRRSSPMRGNAGSRGSRTPETPRRRMTETTCGAGCFRWSRSAGRAPRRPLYGSRGARRRRPRCWTRSGRRTSRTRRGGAPGTLNAAAIAALPPPRAANALRTWLLARHRIPPPPRRWLRVLAEEVAAAGSDRRPEAVRAGIWVRRYRGELHTGREGTPPRLPESTGWRIDGEPLDLPHGRLAAVRTAGEGIADARLPPFVEVRFRRGGERCRPPRARCHQAAQAPDAGARCSPLGTRGVAARIRRRPYRRGSGTLRLRALRRARGRAGLAPRVDPPPAGRYPFLDHVAQADALSCRAAYRLPPPGAARGMNGGSLRTGME